MESVAIVRWPKDAERRTALALRRMPCLWLVDADAEPPVIEAWEDWVRLPADEQDVLARTRSLERLCRPVLLDDAILYNSLGSVALSLAEAVVVQALLEGAGGLVAREELENALWPEGPPSSRALHDLIYRLRRRLAPLQLNVFSERGRGFVLGVALESATRPSPPDEEGDSTRSPCAPGRAQEHRSTRRSNGSDTVADS
jgi:DNA-binding winged helix-turn-helix (wHTH) protein